MAGPFKYDHAELLATMGTPRAAIPAIEGNIQRAFAAGLELKSEISLNGSASGFTGARPATERAIV